MGLTNRYVTATGSDTYANSISISTPMSWATMLLNATAGDVINILVGAYSRTTNADTFTSLGTVTSPLVLRGYSGSIGDGYLGRTNGNGPLITTNFPVITYTTGKLTLPAFTLVDCLSLTGAPTSSANVLLTGADCVVIHSKSVYTGTAATGSCFSVAARALLFDCDASFTGASGGAAAVLNTSTGAVDSCRITSASSSAAGMNIASAGIAYGNVIYAASGVGINSSVNSGASYLRNNTIVGCTGAGISILTGTTTLQRIIGNMITDNTGVAIDMVSTANAGWLGYNRTRDNSSAIANGGDWITASTFSHVTTDTGGPETDYVASGSNDYRLIGGSPARGAGFYPYQDIGALQKQGLGVGSTTFGG